MFQLMNLKLNQLCKLTLNKTLAQCLIKELEIKPNIYKLTLNELMLNVCLKITKYTT